MEPTRTQHDAAAADGGARYQTSIVVGLSLVAGVTLFAIISLVMPESAGTAAGAGNARMFYYVWLALAVGAVLGAGTVWRVVVSPAIQDAARSGEAAAPEAPGRVQMGLVITWAILEGAALFGVVVHFLFGNQTALGGGLALMWIGFALTRPQRHWFGGSGV